MTELNQKWKIGDCQDLMQDLEPDSVDLIVTDPPYGYSFMGKDWDKAIPPVKCWKECLRILKPGAFAFIMSAPRQDVLAHNLVNLSDAGFETGFTSIYWTFASGFPKAGNIGKMVDKRAGRIEHSVKKIKKMLHTQFKKSNLTLKELNRLCGFEASGYLRQTSTWETVLPSQEKWTILKSVLKCSGDPFDDIFVEAEREITGIDKRRSLNGNTYTPHSDTNSLHWNRKDTPATPEAKELDGSYAGFQPKPAVEIIMVVMKPLSKSTYVDQALVNGKGITWLDDGRIPVAAGDRHEYGVNGNEGDPIMNTYGERDRVAYQQKKEGRFPANMLVSDDVLNDGNVTHGSDSIRHNNKIAYGENGDRIYGKYDNCCSTGPADSGSFSRYFDIDAWMSEQIKQLPKEAQKTFPFLITPKASKAEKGVDCTHPTVKPVKLISWLITIGSRKDDLVLDPFLGSGTTLEAGRFTNRRVLGFEISDEWEHLYNARCMSHQPPLTTNYV